MANGKYKATITTNGKSKHLKCWPTAYEAALAYDRAAREYFGEFVFFNFPLEIGGKLPSDLPPILAI